MYHINPNKPKTVYVGPIQRTDKDYWRLENGHLVRVHRKWRTALFEPRDQRGMPISFEKLLGQRTTTIEYEDGHVETITDDWLTSLNPTRCTPTRDASTKSKFSDGSMMEHHDDWTKGDDELENETRTWTGITEFCNRNEDRNASKKIQEAIPDDPEQLRETQPARGLPVPRQPSQHEREEHELTHLPFRAWCKTCVAAKQNKQIDEIVYNLMLFFSLKATDKMQFEW